MSGEVVQAAPVEASVVALREDATELETWAFDLSQAYQIAVRLVTTSFVPATYSGKPEEAAAAIMTGREVGLSPLAALRSIDIIQGIPAMRAAALRALVQSAGHEIWVQESTATRAVMRGRRRGSDTVQESQWTIERARDLGLVSKDNWRKQPIAMLLARATSELVRLIAADVILGIPYSVEEVADQAPDVPADVPAKKATSTVKRRTLPKADAVEPPLPDEEPSKGDPVVEQSSEVEPVVEAVPERDEAVVAEQARKAFEEPALDWGEGS